MKTFTSIRDAVVEQAAQRMADEIDWQVLCSLLKECGWTEVQIPWSDMTEYLAHEIKEWCRANLKGDYKGRGRTWIFSDGKDASMFILRWI